MHAAVFLRPGQLSRQHGERNSPRHALASRCLRRTDMSQPARANGVHRGAAVATAGGQRRTSVAGQATQSGAM